MRTLVIAFFIFLSLAPMALAQGAPPGGTVQTNTGNTSGIQTNTGNTGTNVTLMNPLKATTLSGFLTSILDFVIYLGSIVVILMLVFVGFKFVVAQGSDTKISEARTMLLWTVIGALVLLGSKAIAMAVQATVSALGG